jgi:2-keto-4-pentenoate hydratase/2-oxohepta-3-ene-1,7-dioic acid hydratase in catechol pathway
MKFVTYKNDEGTAAGLLVGDRIYGLTSYGLTSMLKVISADAGDLANAAKEAASNPSAPLADVELLAPLPAPPRIFCIGLNYASHASESQMKVQAVPTVFMKLASSVVGHNADVVLPYNSTEPDYEAELAVVIGKGGYRIASKNWEDHVFGYTILNDISARDIQLATSQWTLGKSFPTFSPIGPAIVTKDEIADPHELDIRLTLNGEEMQNSNTRHLIFKIPELIEYISSLTPLQPGDIISTGTPEGVGMGRSPKRWIRDGDTMAITITGLGELRNKATAEAKPETTSTSA